MTGHRVGLFLSAALLALAVCGCADLDTPIGPALRPQSVPRINAVTPKTVTRGQPATVAVSGTGFLPDFTAFVGTALRETPEFVASQLAVTRFVGSTKLELELPPTLPAGDLDVTIINLDDGLARSLRGLTVVKPPGVAGIEGPQRKGEKR